jgi:glycosyltransferase involved in cell wall biosynthesis
MSDTPSISVVMSVYNGENFIRESVETILNQSFEDYEFIIIDDGSTDSSLKLLQ